MEKNTPFIPLPSTLLFSLPRSFTCLILFPLKSDLLLNNIGSQELHFMASTFEDRQKV